MKHKVLVWGGYATLIIFLLFISFYAGRSLAKPGDVLAKGYVEASLPDPPNALNAPNANFYCASVNNVAAFDNRVHLRCSPADGSIAYFAYATDPSNIATANQILAVANTAFALGEGVWVYYYSSSDYNPPGCNIGDCRGLYGVSMVK
jgi:hypothetical protein